MKYATTLMLCAAVCFFAAGCNSDLPPPDPGPVAQNEDAGGHDHSHDGDSHGHSHDGADAHDHSHDPPNGGQLFEIGTEHEYHAEVLGSESGTVTVFILGTHLQPYMIAQSTLALQFESDDEVKEFELLATMPGGSSTFTSGNADLLAWVSGSNAKGKLLITIGGTRYEAPFELNKDD